MRILAKKRRDFKRSKVSYAEWKRFEWTLGLFAIGLIVPLIFLLPRLPEQAKVETFNYTHNKVLAMTQRIAKKASLEGAARALRADAMDSLVISITQGEYRNSSFKFFGKIFLQRNGETLSETAMVTPIPWFFRIGRGYLSSPYREERSAGKVFERRFTLDGPLASYSLTFSAEHIPYGRALLLVAFDLMVLISAVVVGFILLGRLGIKHIELMEKHRDFVSSVSHELKTPLTAIKMYAEMLKNQRFESKEEMGSCADYILSEASRLEHLVTNVLKISDTEEIPLSYINMDGISNLFERVFEIVRARACRLGFTVILDKSGAAAPARKISFLVNEDALVSVLLNLIDNAFKFSAAADNKQVVIGFSVSSSHTLQFFVQDFGPGIPGCEREKIFELFYRGQSTSVQTTMGTGIGLAVVKQLTRKMNATVRAEEQSPGVKFCVDIPLALSA